MSQSDSIEEKIAYLQNVSQSGHTKRIREQTLAGISKLLHSTAWRDQNNNTNVTTILHLLWTPLDGFSNSIRRQTCEVMTELGALDQTEISVCLTSFLKKSIIPLAHDRVSVLAAIGYICSYLRFHHSINAEHKWISPLLTQLNELLCRIEDNSTEHFQKSVAHLRYAITNPSLSQKLLDHIVHASEQGRKVPIASVATAMVSQSIKLDASIFNICIQQLLQRPQTRGADFIYARILSDASAQSIQVALEKCFPKSPDTPAFHGLAQLLRSMTTCCDFVYSKPVVSGIVSAASAASNTDKSDAACTLAALIAEKCAKHEGLIQFANALITILTQRKAQVPMWQQRFAVVTSISALSEGLLQNTVLAPAGKEEIALKIATEMLKFARTENQPSTCRAAVVAAIRASQLLTCLPEAMIQSISELLKPALAIKADTKELLGSDEMFKICACCEGLSMLSNNDKFHDSLGGFVKVLGVIVAWIELFDASAASFSFEFVHHSIIFALDTLVKISASNEDAAKLLRNGTAGPTESSVASLTTSSSATAPPAPSSKPGVVNISALRAVSTGKSGKGGKGKPKPLPPALRAAAAAAALPKAKATSSGQQSNTLQKAAVTGVDLEGLLMNKRCLLFSAKLCSVEGDVNIVSSRMYAVLDIIVNALSKVSSNMGQAAADVVNKQSLLTLFSASSLNSIRADLIGEFTHPQDTLKDSKYWDSLQLAQQKRAESSKSGRSGTSKNPPNTLRVDVPEFSPEMCASVPKLRYASPIFTALIRLLGSSSVCIRSLVAAKLYPLYNALPMLPEQLLHALVGMLMNETEKRRVDELKTLRHVFKTEYAMLPTSSILSPGSDISLSIKQQLLSAILSGRNSEPASTPDSLSKRLYERKCGSYRHRMDVGVRSLDFNAALNGIFPSQRASQIELNKVQHIVDSSAFVSVFGYAAKAHIGRGISAPVPAPANPYDSMSLNGQHMVAAVALAAHHPLVSSSSKQAWRTWRTLYLRLTTLSGIETSLRKARSQLERQFVDSTTLQRFGTPDTATTATETFINPPCSNLDILLQSSISCNALQKWLSGSSGVMCCVPQVRKMAIQCISSLMRGVADMLPKSQKQGNSAGAGARGVIAGIILPDMVECINHELQCKESTPAEVAQRLFKSSNLTQTIDISSVNTGIAALSEEDVHVWSCPQGELAPPLHGASDYSSTTPSSSGRSSKGGNTDSEWFEQLKREQDAKRRKQTGELSAEDLAIQAYVQEQQLLRMHVQLVYERLAAASDALHAIFDSDVIVSQHLIPVVLPVAIPLMQSKLSREHARPLLETLVRSGLNGGCQSYNVNQSLLSHTIDALHLVAYHDALAKAAEVVELVNEKREEALRSLSDRNTSKQTQISCPVFSIAARSKLSDLLCLPSESSCTTLESSARTFETVVRLAFTSAERAAASGNGESGLSIYGLHCLLPALDVVLSSWPPMTAQSMAYQLLVRQARVDRFESCSMTLQSADGQSHTSQCALTAGLSLLFVSAPGNAEDSVNAMRAFGIAACSNFNVVPEAIIMAHRIARMAMVGSTLRVIDSELMLPFPADALLSKFVNGTWEVSNAHPASALSAGELALPLADDASLSVRPQVRHATLAALQSFFEIQQLEPSTASASNTSAHAVTLPAFDPIAMLVCRVWLCMYDPEESIRSKAQEVWDKFSLQLPPTAWECLRNFLGAADDEMRKVVAKASAVMLKMQAQQIPQAVSDLLNRFKSLVPVVPAADTPESDGDSRHRTSVLHCLASIAEQGALAEEQLNSVLDFVIAWGLSDRAVATRVAALSAGETLIDAFASSHAPALIKRINEFVEEGKTSRLAAEEEVLHDYQREGAVVLLGAAAKHLPAGDPKIYNSIGTLIAAAVKTPSEPVQQAVARCLPPLAKLQKDSIGPVIDDVLLKLAIEGSYGERRGAAYALAGIIKGTGLAALKAHNIIAKLEDAAQDKARPSARQGALLAFECLSSTLRLLFEPYVIRVLPLLLKSFGDNKEEVRLAADETAKVIMANLTGHGVKMVLPSLLEGTQDDQWRSKTASIALLGDMAYCAPKQLASALPKIVPRLIDTFSDTHPKVQAAARKALGDIGRVVQNAEIAEIAPQLLHALSEPASGTKAALEALSNAAFVHAIDPASLALVMPVIRRGLRERVASTKRTACILVSNITALVADPDHIVPYLPLIIPILKKVCIDPIPDVRATAANALGSLTRGVGPDVLAEFNVSDWLIDMICSTMSVVERSGGAQTGCAYYMALGQDALVQWLESKVLPLTTDEAFSSREGSLWVLAFLPETLRNAFASILDLVFPIVIRGLSDDVDSVREVALRAGEMIVQQHALSHTELVLDPLRGGLFDRNWRIRECSIRLIGALILAVSGMHRATSQSTFGNDDVQNVDSDDEGNEKDQSTNNMSTADIGSISTALDSHLGFQLRTELFSDLYIVRFDLSQVVKQTAMRTWKNVVQHPPKVLKAILPALMKRVIELLSAPVEDHRIVAGKCLGDVVRKLGERVLPQVVPILRAGLDSDNEQIRMGVCLGLSEAIGATGKKHLEEYLPAVLPAIRDALCDSNSSVREAAAVTFDTLQQTIGMKAIDSIIPALLDHLDSDDDQASQRAMHGLREILSLRSREVLPFLIPKLTAAPISEFQLRALAAVSEVSGDVLHMHFNKILPALIDCLAMEDQDTVLEDQDTAISERLKSTYGKSGQTIVLSVRSTGVHWLLSELCKRINDDDHNRGWAAAWLLGEFCAGRSAEDFEQQLPMLLKDIIFKLADNSHKPSLQATVSAFKSISTAVGPERMVCELSFMNDCMRSAISEGKNKAGGVSLLPTASAQKKKESYEMPGLSLPKGIEPLLPAYQHALLHGNAETREAAAVGLGEIVAASSSTTLRPYFIKITGPLIRTVADKYPAKVKAAILSTLSIVMDKAGVALKPFLPQLQTTFVKALNDADKNVRSRGANALGKLMELAPRVDPLVNELCNGITSAVGGIRDAMLDALHNVLQVAGSKITPTFRNKAVQLLTSLMTADDDLLRTLAGMSLGVSLIHLEPHGEEANEIIQILFEETSDPRKHHSQLHGIRAAFKHASSVCGVRLIQEGSVDSVIRGLHSSDFSVNEVAIACVGVILSCADGLEATVPSSSELKALLEDNSIAGPLIQGLQDTLGADTSDLRRFAARAVERCARYSPNSMSKPEILAFIMPPLVRCVRDSNVGVKHEAECAVVKILRLKGSKQEHERVIEAYRAHGGDPAVLQFINDYARRVLRKMPEDDEDEDSDAEFL